MNYQPNGWDLDKSGSVNLCAKCGKVSATLLCDKCKKPKGKSEKRIQSEIQAALGSEADLTIFRNSVGQVTAQSGATLKYGLGTHSSDLVGILGPTGRWFCLEVKRPGLKARAGQSRWLEHIREKGGFAAVVHSADEALAALARARKGESQ